MPQLEVEARPVARKALASGVRLRVPARPDHKGRVGGSALLGLLALSAALVVIAVEQDPPPTAATPADHGTTVGRQLDKPQRWFRPEVTVVIDASLEQIGPDSKLAVQNAFGEWLATGSKLPALSFTEGRNIAPSLDPDGVNSVIYAPIEFEGHRDDLAITIGFSDDETGEITEADIIINARQPFGSLAAPWSSTRAHSCNGELEPALCGHRYDLQNVLTHEVGHFYGLGEDETDRTATMFSCTSPCETHKRRLAPSDVELISSVYASGYEQSWAAMGCTLGSGQTDPGGAGWVTSALLGLAVLARRWRR